MVFSRGYGLEDDEKAAGDQSFKFTVGDNGVIQALNDAIPGMEGKNIMSILKITIVILMTHIGKCFVATSICTINQSDHFVESPSYHRKDGTKIPNNAMEDPVVPAQEVT